MESTPKVSVIFPIFNNEKYIESCIRSVMNQTLRDIEMILIDDGSTDSAPSILDALAEEDSRIRVIHKENEGVAAGENLGLTLATGEYIGFVEADDTVEPNMFERLYDQAVAVDAEVAKCGFYYCEKGNKHEFSAFYRLAEEGDVFSPVDKPNLFMYHASMWAAIYKSSFIKQYDIKNIVTPSASYTDFSWSMMVYAYANRMTIVHEALYNYTYDNPASSRIQEGEKCLYKPYHCLEANRILRKANRFEQVKEEIGYHEYTTCLSHAKRIKPELKDIYFEKYREVMLDLVRDGFGYEKFLFIEKRIAQYIVNGEKDRFYRSVSIINRVRNNAIVNLVWWKLKRMKYVIIH